eukprot:349769-Chlamydomonas_euryale.AAC.2
MRRVAAVLGGGKDRRAAAGRCAVVDVVAAPDVPLFRVAECWYTSPVRHLPVHVADIFGP